MKCSVPNCTACAACTEGRTCICGSRHVLIRNSIKGEMQIAEPPVAPPRSSRPGPQKCGECRTCANPKLKKACLQFRKERGDVPKKKSATELVRASEPSPGLSSGHGRSLPTGSEQSGDGRPPSAVSEIDAEELQRRRRELQRPARKWIKAWLPQDTILNSGSCKLYRWVAADVLDPSKKVPTAANEQEQAAAGSGGEEEETDLSKRSLTAPNYPAAKMMKPHTPTSEGQSPGLRQGGGLPLPRSSHAAPARPMLGHWYVCPVDGCGKMFIDAAGLRKHGSVHSERQFLCPHEGCGKRFVDNSKLKRHLLVHSGEKQFVCPIEGCGKAFSLDFNLRSHVRTHAAGNYFPCHHKDCDKRFTNEAKLQAHLLLHEESDGTAKRNEGFSEAGQASSTPTTPGDEPLMSRPTLTTLKGAVKNEGNDGSGTESD